MKKLRIGNKFQPQNPPLTSIEKLSSIARVTSVNSQVSESSCVVDYEWHQNFNLQGNIRPFFHLTSRLRTLWFSSCKKVQYLNKTSAERSFDGCVTDSLNNKALLTRKEKI